MNIFDLVKEELVGVILTNNDLEIKEYSARIELSVKGKELFTVYDNEKMPVYKDTKYRFTSYYYFTKGRAEERHDIEWAINTDNEEDILLKIRELLLEVGV